MEIPITWLVKAKAMAATFFKWRKTSYPLPPTQKKYLPLPPPNSPATPYLAPVEIKINFTINNKQYSGELSKINGAGANTWFLMVNNYYCGQLVFSNHYGWRFTSNKTTDASLGPYFASLLPEEYRNIESSCNCFLCAEKQRG